MRLHVESLGTFYEMAREGAGVAARRLTRMTSIPTRVGVTRLDFTDRGMLRSEFGAERDRVGIRVDLDGGLPGTSAILFGEETAREIVSTLADDVPLREQENLGRSAIVEVAQVMNNGFVDGWADVLQTTIDVAAPEYVTDEDAESVLGGSALDAAHEELALVFRNSIEAVGTELDFEHYLVPDHEAMAALLADGAEGEGIEHRKLTAFDRMAQRGADRVADNLSKTAGMDVTVDLRRINFLSLDAIPEGVSEEPHVSVAFSYSGVLSGYLLFLYDEASARDLVRSAVGDDATALGGMGRDAIKELSNIMASGLLDGWANMLEETIDHSTPAYAYDMGAAVIDPLIVGLSERQEFAFVFDTRVTAVDSGFDVEMYAIPDEADLERALSRLEPARAADTPTTAHLRMNEIRDGAPDDVLDDRAGVPTGDGPATDEAVEEVEQS